MNKNQLTPLFFCSLCLLLTVFVSSCQNEPKGDASFLPAFDLDTFLATTIAQMPEDISIRKEVYQGQNFQEEVISKEEFEKLLNITAEFNLRKKALRGVYDSTAIQHSAPIDDWKTVRYQKRSGEKQAVDKMYLTYLPGDAFDAPSIVVAYRKNDNFLYRNEQTLFIKKDLETGNFKKAGLLNRQKILLLRPRNIRIKWSR